MEEPKEKKINGFDDRNMDEQLSEIVKRGRENKKLSDDFLDMLVKRIKEGLTTFERELNSIPDDYKEKFIKLYKDSK